MLNPKKYVVLCLCLSFVVLVSTLGLSKIGNSVAAWQSKADETPVFVIDPGHGGEDGGTSDAYGRKESDINLSISLRLRDLLRLLGAQTHMIREADTSVESEGASIAARKVSDIRNRVQMTEDTPNAYLISIHQNHYPEGKYRGAQVFYSKTEESQGWAESLQKLINTQVDPKNHRECKLARDIYLMEHVHCPAILVECGFLSNNEEAALLQEASYQKKLAAAIACSAMGITEDKNEI
ncbi:MAG: N-acetylmuramoyl-L-alanine amidase [Oscillospiraceae bacterium]|nr:N-acetylmuramoyl-L-alanine amidase [Oscillospiraceae bacterium]